MLRPARRLPAPTSATPIFPGFGASVRSRVVRVAASSRSGIGEQDEQRLRLARLERLVRRLRLVDRERLLPEAVERDAALGEQAQVLLHVPVLRPADVADRVVLALELVDVVVAAGAVRGRDQEVELLLVHVGALEVEADVADEDDAALLAARLHRLADDLVALGRGGDQDGVGAEAVGQLVDAAREVLARADPVRHARARAPSRSAVGSRSEPITRRRSPAGAARRAGRGCRGR